MDRLVFLAEHPNQPVSKEQLIERVWNGRYVTDDVLTVTIYALRKAFGDAARRPLYIETVSRRGYRLIAPVKSVSPPAQSEAAVKIEMSGGQREGWQRARFFWPAVAASVALGLLASAVWMLSLVRHRPVGRHVGPAEAHGAHVR